MNSNLASFLDLGFFLDYQNKEFRLDLNTIDKSKYMGATLEELVPVASSIWRDTIGTRYNPNEQHVLPISAGLDSRAVLGVLLEFTPAANLSTFTYGVPGSWDYDLGAKLAKKIGTKHVSFNLNNYNYNQDELIDISKRSDHQAVLFHHWPVWQIDELYKDHTFWMGYLGVVTGAYLNNNMSASLEEAIVRFKVKNRYVKSMNMRENFPSYDHLIDTGLIDPEVSVIDEQLNYNNRQLKFIAPHLLMKGYNMISPLACQPFLSFILSVDDEHRRFQRLYKAFLFHMFPKLFSLPSKYSAGLPIFTPEPLIFTARTLNRIRYKLTGFSKSVNYLPFNSKIREKKDLQKLIRENINDLAERKIIDQIDPVKIFKNHLNKKGDFYDILIVLTSLEIHLKAGKKL